MVAIRESKTFYFDFDQPKNINENLKDKIEFIIKSNEPLAENKTRNRIKSLLSKYMYGNSIHEHVKQRNE